MSLLFRSAYVGLFIAAVLFPISWNLRRIKNDFKELPIRASAATKTAMAALTGLIIGPYLLSVGGLTGVLADMDVFGFSLIAAVAALAPALHILTISSTYTVTVLARRLPYPVQVLVQLAYIILALACWVVLLPDIFTLLFYQSDPPTITILVLSGIALLSCVYKWIVRKRRRRFFVDPAEQAFAGFAGATFITALAVLVFV